MIERARGSVSILGIVTVGICIAALLVAAAWRWNRASRCSRCAAHLAIIGMALQVYHDVHGLFPPAVTLDGAGKPMHSWRVLLLPYLGRSDLYSRYRLDEPWNSKSNHALSSLMPEVYSGPADTTASEGTTSYVAVAGPHAAWRADKAVRKSDITDGVSETILLVEVSESGVDWLEPRDLTSDEAAGGCRCGGGRFGIRSR